MKSFLKRVKEPKEEFCRGEFELKEPREGLEHSPTAHGLGLKLALAREISDLPFEGWFVLADLET